MLLLDCTISVACPKDTNLAEVVEVAKVRKQMAGGKIEFVPQYAGTYVVGLPFGEQSVPVPAPIDLMAGDRLRVTADTIERYVWDITRRGKVVWANGEAQQVEVAATAERTAKRGGRGREADSD